MNLDLNRITEKIEQNDFIKNFIKELSEMLENSNKKVNGENMENINFNQEEELEFEKKESIFLQEYFQKELEKNSNEEIFIVTSKYENDDEYHRYKLAQYRENKEFKYIVFEKDLPQNIEIGDVVRNINGKYINDEQATRYIKVYRDKIKKDIIDKRQNLSITINQQ